MPKVIVTNMSPGQLFQRALTMARTASGHIERLKSTPLAPGETVQDRALVVIVHAHALAEAFDVIDALADAACDDAFNDSPLPPSRADARPGAQGCAAREEDPNTN